MLPPGSPPPCPLAGFRPLLRDLTLETCKGSGERHHARFRPIRESYQFHPAGVWLVGLLVSRGALLRRALTDFNGDVGLALRRAAMCFLAWSAYIWLGLGSSEAIRLMPASVFVNIVTLSAVVCRLSRFQRPDEGGALCVVGFLVVFHI